MARKKVKLAWIVNDRARKISLKKRRLGLLKKVSELATLCDVNTFVIIYSPDDDEPAIWPSRPMVEQMLARFQSLPEIERTKKLMNQDTYLKERLSKEHKQYKKLNMKNLEVEMGHLMSQIYKGKTLDRFHIIELQGLAWFVLEKMNEIKKRVNYFQQISLPQESLPPYSPAPGDDIGIIESSGGDVNTTQNPLIEQWMIDLLKNSENVAGSSNVGKDIRLPHTDIHVGSSNITNDVELLPHGAFRGHIGKSDMGLLPHGNTGDSNSENIIRLGLGIQLQKNIIGSNNANDIGLGQQPQRIEGACIGGSEMGLPFGIFGDNSEESDIGFPFDVTK